MLGRLEGRIGHSQHLYRMYFSLVESMEKLWEFYCAPETQKGLIDRRKKDEAAKYALSIKGNFSYGVTPKLD